MNKNELFFKVHVSKIESLQDSYLYGKNIYLVSKYAHAPQLLTHAEFQRKANRIHMDVIPYIFEERGSKNNLKIIQISIKIKEGKFFARLNYFTLSGSCRSGKLKTFRNFKENAWAVCKGELWFPLEIRNWCHQEITPAQLPETLPET